jgi:hypothetical protein
MKIKNGLILIASSFFGLGMALANPYNEGTCVLMCLLCIITFMVGMFSDD